MTATRKRLAAGLSALAVAVVSVTLTAAAPVSASEVVPLPEHLEAIRAAEATELYGSPEIRPMAERSTSIMTMGDSQISGEGVGNYLPETHQDGNWCDRSYDQAIFRTGIESDVQYNIACSGGVSQNLIRETGETQWDELNQGDNLAIKARNTKLKLIWIVIGANDKGGIEFGPTMSDCVKNRILFKGPCWEDETDTWAARVQVAGQGVGNAIDGVRQTMTDAGYVNSDYELVVMGYPTPINPDVKDNPDFPGWIGGGCLIYKEDLAFARNKAVPLFNNAIRDAVLASDARYLDASRLFDGHGVCEDNTWARGLYIEIPVLPSEHAFRQSFHPNFRGHGAFAACVTSLVNTDWQAATCVDPASTGSTVLYEGLLEFKDIKGDETGYCLDAEGYSSRNGTKLMSYDCHGGRNQGFWYSADQQTLHVELSHDRCVDATSGTEGADVTVHDCHGGTNQDFILDGSLIRLAMNPDLCLSMSAEHTGAARVAVCGTAGTSLSMSSRDYADPVGYGHDDWIPSDL
ncbi:ricin-type beta-trefoil lectin domain protein [Stackebrandtia soli]|uniref:ricin-type beta-trefoil lectin domain protein n=1 Tax=Stackebrandtia soli TaxID=1892856 RepID=UPI0039EA7B52